MRNVVMTELTMRVTGRAQYEPAIGSKPRQLYATLDCALAAHCPSLATHSTVCHMTTGHSPGVEERLSNARARARVSPCCASIETSNQSLRTSSDVSSVTRSGRGRRVLKSATLVNGVFARDATSKAAAAGSRPPTVAASTSAGAVLTLTAVGASSAATKGRARVIDAGPTSRTRSSSPIRRTGALAASVGIGCARYHSSSAPPGSVALSSASTQSVTALTRLGGSASAAIRRCRAARVDVAAVEVVDRLLILIRL